MKIDLEKIVIVLFFLAALYLGPGVMLNHSIAHDFPYGYGASDAFQHQVRAESIKDAGNFRYEASYISKGVEGSIGRYPPILYHLAVIISKSANIEVYDSIIFLVTLFSILASLVFYFVVRHFNRTVALLCLPICLLIFSFPVSLGFLYGHWPSLLSQTFLIFVVWIVVNREIPHGYAFLGIGLAATALTHTSETIFAFLFLLIFYGLKFAFGRWEREDMKAIFLGTVVFLIVGGYYLIIFLNTWAKVQPYQFRIQPIWDGNPGFYLIGFGILGIFLLIGFIMALSKIKELPVALIAAFSFLLAGLMNYIGFELRSFQIRFFWPIYLSVLIALGIYVIIKLATQWNLILTISCTAILFFCVSGLIVFPAIGKTSYASIPSIPQLNLQSTQGIMNPYHWQALQWLGKNTEKDARIYFFFGTIYNQDALLRNAKRVHYQVVPEDLIPVVQDRKIERNYMSEKPGDDGGAITLRKGFFDFKRVEIPIEEIYGMEDICTFNYLVFDRQPEHPLIQYNILIANELVNKGMTQVYQNDVVIVLKNNNLGSECIAQGTF